LVLSEDPGSGIVDPVRKLRVASCFVVALWAAPAMSQEVSLTSVRGRVVAADGTPIQRASIEVLGRQETASTSVSGEFELLLVTGDSVGIRVRALGYSPSTRWMRISASSVSLAPIVLEAIAAQLDRVTVRGQKPDSFAYTTKYDDYFRRRRMGQGTFREQEDFQKRGAPDVVGALQGIPGVKISLTSDPNGVPEVRFQMARCPRQPPSILLYVNGKKEPIFGKNSQDQGSELSSMTFRRSDPSRKINTCEDCARLAELLFGFALSDILFIEYYRGPGQIPSDVDRGDACAALMIWTR
jgi:hypothetical protein